LNNIARLVFVALTLVPTAPVHAQSDFPARPVRIIVNFATGGPSDIVARILAVRLSESWGKSVVVENITGGGGNIGVERAIKATRDGYTLLLSGSSPLVINPSLQDKPAFDTVRDLAPLTLVCTIIIQADLAKWAKVIRAAGVKAE
jgi:tripartite-type tricarboxylate transporter receptor subunit TctC